LNAIRAIAKKRHAILNAGSSEVRLFRHQHAGDSATDYTRTATFINMSRADHLEIRKNRKTQGQGETFPAVIHFLPPA
jgi:hypothetical protein